MKKEVKIGLGILAIAIVLVTIGLLGYKYYFATGKIKNTVSEMPKQTQNPTAEWPTYQNNKLGFTIKYPKGWKEKEGDERHVTFSSGTNQNNIYLSINTGSLESNLDKGFVGPVRNVKKDNIIIDDKKAYRISAETLIEDTGNGEKWSSQPSVFTFISNDKDNETFVLSTDVNGNTLYENMLSTIEMR